MSHDFYTLLDDSKAREKLSLKQLSEFFTELKATGSSLGKGKKWDSPADMAYEMSRKMGFKKNLWNRAKHLELLNEKLVANARGDIGPLMVSMPPRHGKSLLISFWYPLWKLTRNPEEEIMFLTYGDLFAQEWGGKARDFLINFGEDLGITLLGNSQSRKFWNTEQGGSYYAAGIEGTITGKGCTTLILDDPIKGHEAASSQLMRDKILKAWQETIITRAHGTIVIVGTRWHEDDLLGRLEILSESGVGIKFEVLKLPALAEAGDLLGRKEGEALWPDSMWTREKILQIKSGQESDPLNPTGSPYAFSALYQQRPTPEEGAAIKRTWWKSYTIPPAEFDEIIMSWDLAFKDLKTSDLVVGQVWGRSGGLFYLLDMVRDRMNFPETVAAFENMCVKWPGARRKLVEDSANAPALIASLARAIHGIIPVRPKGSKDARLSAVSPAIESGNVYIPEFKKAKWVTDLVEEAATFPNAAHDDTVDALSMALNYFMPAGHHYTIKEAREAAVVKPKTTVDIMHNEFHAFMHKKSEENRGRFMNSQKRLNRFYTGRG